MVVRVLRSAMLLLDNREQSFVYNNEPGYCTVRWRQFIEAISDFS